MAGYDVKRTENRLRFEVRMTMMIMMMMICVAAQIATYLPPHHICRWHVIYVRRSIHRPIL
jgi:hypothetical protein